MIRSLSLRTRCASASNRWSAAPTAALAEDWALLAVDLAARDRVPLERVPLERVPLDGVPLDGVPLDRVPLDRVVRVPLDRDELPRDDDELRDDVPDERRVPPPRDDEPELEPLLLAWGNLFFLLAVGM